MHPGHVQALHFVLLFIVEVGEFVQSELSLGILFAEVSNLLSGGGEILLTLRHFCCVFEVSVVLGGPSFEVGVSAIGIAVSVADGLA